MNQQDRRTYSDLNTKQSNRIIKSFLGDLYNALRDQVFAFVNILQERGIDAGVRQLDRYLLNVQMSEAVRELHIEAGLYFARKTYREIRRSIKTKEASFGFNEEWTQAIINYLKTHHLQHIAGITDETKQQILSVLDKAVREGWGINKIAEELKSPELLLYRARRIARTELNIASHTGRKAAEETSDFETEKEWIAANDHRTRSSHRQIDGEVIDSESRFQVQRASGGVDMMEGPGDPNASIENLINCRCSLAVKAKRDKNGNLIPKTKRVTIIDAGLFNPKRTIITI